MVASLCVLFEALSVVFCLHILYGKRLYLNGATIGFVLLDMALMICVNLFHLDQRWSFSIYPIIMVYCAIEFELNFKAIFVNNILYLVIISILQAVMMLLTWLLFQKLGTIEQMIINFMILGIVIWVLPKCRLDKLSNLLQRNERLITYALLIMIMGMFGFLIKYKSNIGFDLYYYIILLFSLLLIISAAVSIGKSKLKEAEVEAELRLHKLYEESFRNLIDDISAKQHEFDNHINALYSQHFLYNSYEELVSAQRSYCQMVINENNFNKLLSKGNATILGFLYGKFMEAEKKNINVRYKINIDDLACHVPIYKIVELLGNLVNNAIEELQKNGVMKELNMTFVETEKEICVAIKNPVQEINYELLQNLFKKGFSNKARGRGYGLYNVKKICDEYKLHINCFYEEEKNVNWLCFKLIINKTPI